jgi:hypothetical protein
MPSQARGPTIHDMEFYNSKKRERLTARQGAVLVKSQVVA